MRAHDLLSDELDKVIAKHCGKLKASMEEFFVGINDKFNIMLF